MPPVNPAIVSTGSLSTPRYSYVSTDLVTGKIIEEIPLSNVQFGLKLSGSGQLSGNVPLINTQQKKLLVDATPAGRTGLYVIRNGVPIWGGIIWKRQYTSGSRAVQLQAETFESYLFKIFQKRTFFYDQADQFAIGYDFWSQAFDQPHAPRAAFDTAGSSTCGVLRDRTIFDYEYKTVGDELQALAGLENGFDFNFRIELDGTTFLPKMYFGYPTLGLTRDVTTLLFEYPDHIQDFNLTEDAAGSSTTTYAIGAGEGEEQLFIVAAATDLLDSGYPLLETSRSYKTVYRPSTLTAHANDDLKRLRPPVTIISATLRGSVEPVLGSFFPGDWARFRIDDLFLGSNFDQYYRITEMSVTPPEQGSAETVQLVMGDSVPTVFPGDPVDTGSTF